MRSTFIFNGDIDLSRPGLAAQLGSKPTTCNDAREVVMLLDANIGRQPEGLQRNMKGNSPSKRPRPYSTTHSATAATAGR
tara:strand:+ start:113 stop:352 length:240 start_codon:yes stop_codon:yes gene_type:complete